LILSYKVWVEVFASVRNDNYSRQTSRSSPAAANHPVAVLPEMAKQQQELSSGQNQKALTNREFPMMSIYFESWD
jgi:hypothetical protein